MDEEQIQIHTQKNSPIFSNITKPKAFSIADILIFLMKDFIYWWYIQMPIFYLNKTERILTVISDKLSLKILFQNLFLPSKEHKSKKIYILGIIIKIFYLPIASTIYLITLILCILGIIFWLILPIINIIFILISLL